VKALSRPSSSEGENENENENRNEAGEKTYNIYFVTKRIRGPDLQNMGFTPHGASLAQAQLSIKHKQIPSLARPDT
jgi:hypothetical protein